MAPCLLIRRDWCAASVQREELTESESLPPCQYVCPPAVCVCVSAWAELVRRVCDVTALFLGVAGAEDCPLLRGRGSAPGAAGVAAEPRCRRLEMIAFDEKYTMSLAD